MLYYLLIGFIYATYACLKSGSVHGVIFVSKLLSWPIILVGHIPWVANLLMVATTKWLVFANDMIAKIKDKLGQ